ncbi:glycosyltransferase family 9 protein [Subsaximicrobium wynnwilliamsii]|uniref:Glycosyltransferase family 9 protein n=2 Tax=Subsaximicrobium wynnwilliamsii TaxID=291179 RepID=A0A5C6ZM37_9FLAO|nr:glycosyltransferase family 9 protein [Subsaximicrobium wynnwilliamsii]TXD89734.1 glycosyltransferase family 9 protein [Subsaximicrobium wynnwilliamsii]TXE01716.1 glycosyltransferase family 9 protein [Subsaximicrobium wynnwilliamsii]
MGDVAMTVPVLRALVAQYPEVRLSVLTRAFFKPFFRDLPNVSVFEADLKGRHKGLFGLWKLSQELRALGFDAVADLHNVLRTKILKCFFFGRKVVQIDKGRAEKKALVTGQKFEQLKTTHERYADVFEKLGFPLDLSNPSFPERARLSPELLEILGTDTKKWIGIAPFAAFSGKMYPIDLIEKVIEILSKTYKVILFGAGKDEILLIKKLLKGKANSINLAGQLAFSEELDVISNLDVMLAMDSGNAHIAAMLGVEVVTIWGVTHPFAGFYPFNQSKNNAILADRKQFPQIPTSIYGKDYPKGYDKAMRNISPEQVVSKINSILENSAFK